LNSELSVKPKKGDYSMHVFTKINPISPEDYENYAVSDEEDHLPESIFNREDLGLNRSIIMKPKPLMNLNLDNNNNNNYKRNISNKIILEEESVLENNSKNSKNLDIGLNNEKNAEKNKELLKALNNMENEINKSVFNNPMSKSNISNNSKI